MSHVRIRHLWMYWPLLPYKEGAYSTYNSGVSREPRENQSPVDTKEESKNEGEEGFASAIAGIFDGLDGDDALLSEYPDVKFFEDDSLQSGDCQIKSRFGLLDGRIATKLRKIEEELRGND